MFISILKTSCSLFLIEVHADVFVQNEKFMEAVLFYIFGSRILLHKRKKLLRLRYGSQR